MRVVIDIEADALVNPKNFQERRRIWRRSKEYRIHERVRDKIADCKKNGIPCDLKDENDLNWPDNCPILGIPLDYTWKGKSGPRNNSASIDRIIPELGYVKDNVWVISNRANTLKNNASIEELKQFSRWINTL